MDVEIPVLAGYLNVPTQTGFSLNRISKKVRAWPTDLTYSDIFSNPLSLPHTTILKCNATNANI